MRQSLLLDRLHQLYLYDFSEYARLGGAHMADDDGRFAYRWLESYWQAALLDREPARISSGWVSRHSRIFPGSGSDVDSRVMSGCLRRQPRTILLSPPP
jgi:hypothetical protein